MTRNQIEYNKLLESRRANLAQERLTQARDTAAKELGISTLAESSRHNRAVEVLDQQRVSEGARHNKAQEAAEVQRIQEGARHNLASERLEAGRLDVSKGQLAEATRSNKAREAETSRHNRATEAVEIGRAATYAGDTAARALHASRQLAETTRHNMAMEVKDTSPKVVTPITLQPSPVHTSTVVPVQVNVPQQQTLPNGDRKRLPAPKTDTRSGGFSPIPVGPTTFVEWATEAIDDYNQLWRNRLGGK